MDLAKYVRDIPDFPVEGILFKDITPLLQSAQAFRESVQVLTERYQASQIDHVVAVESRGFILGAPLAYTLGSGFIPVRKAGKLPAETIAVKYSLEYGANTLEMHVDAIRPGERVLLVDDLLATGGSAKAATHLIEQLQGIVVEIAFLVELEFLNGRAKLEGYDVFSVVKY